VTAGALREQAGYSSPETPVGDLDRADRHSELSAAMGRLPAEQRAVLELAYFQGLSHSEISGRTSQPLGTVKTRLRLAMQKLREGLGSQRKEEP
jgi:RNA polymerase sigma-70 factor (ECF subfamily)